MSKDKPSFYAVIPATVRYDKSLSSSEKLFYAEVTAMSEKEGFCWASNSYFSELYGVSRNTITRWVTNLKNSGHVVVNLQKEGKQIVKREIYPIQKISDTYPQKSKGGTHKNGDTPTHKNGDDNTTRVNTTRVNIIYSDLIENFPSIKKMEEPLTVEQGELLIEKFGESSVKGILMQMENYKPLNKKNKSAYLTANNWLQRNSKPKSTNNEKYYEDELHKFG